MLRRRISPSSARIATVVALAMVLGCGGLSEGPGSDRDGRPSILFLTIDTLRADHLSCYGYPRRTSPRLDRLASEGVRFDKAIVQWPKTGPSFASMLTSTYPKDNGIVRQVGIPVPQEMRLLAEELRELGYATRAVVANGALASDFGFDQGFETYLETWKRPPEGMLDPDGATRVTDLALSLGRELAEEGEADPAGKRPFFLWVHYLDPHFPYVPPGEFRDLFQDDEHWQGTAQVPVDTQRPTRQLAGIGYQQVLEGRHDLDFYVARYDAEIAYADSEIGRLLDGLSELGLTDRAVTVVSSDHGESLGEHHFYFDHGRFAFQTCARVPLIVHAPDRFTPRVDPHPVQLLDLAPTLLELAGAPLSEGAWKEGRSFLGRLAGTAESPDSLAFSEAGYTTDRKWQRAVQDERFKLVMVPNPIVRRWYGHKRFTLFDLTTDGAETEDVSERFPEDRARLESALRLWFRAKPRGDVAEGQQDQGVDPKTLDQLRALGYID